MGLPWLPEKYAPETKETAYCRSGLPLASSGMAVTSTPCMPLPVRKETVPWMETVLAAVSSLPGKAERFCAVMG
jgi:hypothetical protein